LTDHITESAEKTHRMYQNEWRLPTKPNFSRWEILVPDGSEDQLTLSARTIASIRFSVRTLIDLAVL